MDLIHTMHNIKALTGQTICTGRLQDKVLIMITYMIEAITATTTTVTTVGKSQEEPMDTILNGSHLTRHHIIYPHTTGHIHLQATLIIKWFGMGQSKPGLLMVTLLILNNSKPCIGMEILGGQRSALLAR